ncbi:helix-turn-helix domain-containing protein [Clostridium akagii]|uniref:helix-turn-helix domain-containing protein n=1 Tax=Clostridium akagii TaxID=91623 RepID=UPI00068BC08B|nr:helix-turn-helix transcriptional regulator [Clostridium akagii]
MTFKDLRIKSGLTENTAAKKLGIKEATYRKYEYSMRLPGKLILLQMKEVFKCTGDELLDAFNCHKEVQIKRYGKTNP